MSENTVNPRSRQQDERIIARKQNDFSAGSFSDIPAISVPSNGVHKLKNFINYGDRIEGRPGNKQWGDYSGPTAHADLPTLATGISGSYSTSSGVKTISGISGYSFSDSDVNSFFITDSSTHEQITSVNSVTEIEVATDDDDGSGTYSSSKLRRPLRGLAFHSRYSKILMIIGSDVYISEDIYMTSWIKAAPEYVSTNALDNSFNELKEFNQYMIIFNSNGIYRVDMSSSNFYIVERVNCENPSLLPTTVTDGSTYKYRLTYTYSKLNTSNFLTEDRTDSGVGVALESGNCDANYKFEDYTETSSSTETSTINPKRFGFLRNSLNTNNEFNQAYTHYSIYGTKDLGQNGIDEINGEGNNDQLYIWLEDIPLAKPFEITISGTTVTAIKGSFSLYDVFSGLRFYNSNTGYYETIAISAYTSSTSVTLISSPTDGDIASGVPASIGGSFTKNATMNAFKMTQSSGVISVTNPSTAKTFTADNTTEKLTILSHGFKNGDKVQLTTTGSLPTGLSTNTNYFVLVIDTNTFYLCDSWYSCSQGDFVSFTTNGTGTHSINFAFITESDVGKKLFLSNGTYRHITNVSGATINVAESTSGYDIDTAIVGCIDPSFRSVAHSIDDDTISSRISGYPLRTRFYKNMPNANAGTIAQGFMFAANRGDNYIYYCPLPSGFEYLMGHYHPLYNYSRVNDSITALKEVPDILCVYCSNSTYIIYLNTFSEVDLGDVGVKIAVIEGQTLVDSNVGLLDYGSLQDLDLGKHLMITNEPALRYFDGTRYSDNLSNKRSNRFIEKLNAATSSAYIPYVGYILWGDNT